MSIYYLIIICDEKEVFTKMDFSYSRIKHFMTFLKKRLNDYYCFQYDYKIVYDNTDDRPEMRITLYYAYNYEKGVQTWQKSN